MNEAEARELLSEQINRLRGLPYAGLCRLMNGPEVLEVTGVSGAAYQLEIQAWWDDKVEKNLRVAISIDDGGWRAFIPLTDDFVIAPDGSFVGEWIG